MPIIRAGVTVAARSTSSGVMPASTINSISRSAVGPWNRFGMCGHPPLSVPMTMGTPAS